MKKIILIFIVSLVLTLGACRQDEEGFDTSNNITVYTRDTTSGTRAGFMEGIGFYDAEEDDSVLVEGFVIKDNTGIMTSMTIDEYGIGYISMASLNDTIKGLYFNGVAPTTANVLNDTYGLKRPFMWMTRDVGDFPSTEVEQLVTAFIAFLETTDANDIILNEGAVPLDATMTWDSIKDQHPITQQDNSNVIVRFGGSDSIQRIAQSITQTFSALAGNFVAEHDHTGSSDAFKRTQDPAIKDTPVGKDVGFASRHFKDSEQIDVEQESMGQLAWDAIVVIVHLNNPLENVTAYDLKKIFEGTYSVWSDLITE